jgi:hypothetical protein
LIDDMTPLSGWENFYVIVGSSAGALIGLQFVVMSLIVGMPITRGDAQAGDTFTTPTVVHFGAVSHGWLRASVTPTAGGSRAALFSPLQTGRENAAGCQPALDGMDGMPAWT